LENHLSVQVAQWRQVHVEDARRQLAQVVRRHASGLAVGGPLQLPAGGQQARHGLVRQVVQRAAQQEAVEQGLQGVVLGQVVGGREQRQQRQLVCLGAAAVGALVEDGEQVVENGAVGV